METQIEEEGDFGFLRRSQQGTDEIETPNRLSRREQERDLSNYSFLNKFRRESSISTVAVALSLAVIGAGEKGEVALGWDPHPELLAAERGFFIINVKSETLGIYQFQVPWDTTVAVLTNMAAHHTYTFTIVAAYSDDPSEQSMPSEAVSCILTNSPADTNGPALAAVASAGQAYLLAEDFPGFLTTLSGDPISANINRSSNSFQVQVVGKPGQGVMAETAEQVAGPWTPVYERVIPVDGQWRFSGPLVPELQRKFFRIQERVVLDAEAASE